VYIWTAQLYIDRHVRRVLDAHSLSFLCVLSPLDVAMWKHRSIIRDLRVLTLVESRLLIFRTFFTNSLGLLKCCIHVNEHQLYHHKISLTDMMPLFLYHCEPLNWVFLIMLSLNRLCELLNWVLLILLSLKLFICYFCVLFDQFFILVKKNSLSLLAVLQINLRMF